MFYGEGEAADFVKWKGALRSAFFLADVKILILQRRYPAFPPEKVDDRNTRFCINGRFSVFSAATYFAALFLTIFLCTGLEGGGVGVEAKIELFYTFLFTVSTRRTANILPHKITDLPPLETLRVIQLLRDDKHLQRTSSRWLPMAAQVSRWSQTPQL